MTTSVTSVQACFHLTFNSQLWTSVAMEMCYICQNEDLQKAPYSSLWVIVVAVVARSIV